MDEKHQEEERYEKEDEPFDLILHAIVFFIMMAPFVLFIMWREGLL